MSGEAIVTIGNKQWSCWVASTYEELAHGLSGVASIPQDTGMLFILPQEQLVTVTAEDMLFPLGVVFIGENLQVTEVEPLLAPGDYGTTSLPCRYFLEVNAGETDGVLPGDAVSIEITAEPPAQSADWMAPVVTLASVLMVGVFMTKMSKTMADAMLAKPKEKPLIYGPRGELLLPQTGAGSLPSVRVMPKLPPEAYKDIMFLEYIHDLVRLGEEVTDGEARLMWEAWKKRQPLRLPAVAPKDGEYSWLIIDPETGEIMIKTGYATTDKAKRAARDFALRRSRYAGEHPVKLRIYDRDPNIGNLEAGVVFEGQILIPESEVIEQSSTSLPHTELLQGMPSNQAIFPEDAKRDLTFCRHMWDLEKAMGRPSTKEEIEERWEKWKALRYRPKTEEERRLSHLSKYGIEELPERGTGQLEFLPDTPEFLAYTIDDIGYRDRIDTAFLQAIARAKRR